MRSQQQLLNQVNTDSHCDLLKLIFIKPSPIHTNTLYLFKTSKRGNWEKSSYFIWDSNKNCCRRDGIFEKLYVIE